MNKPFWAGVGFIGIGVVFLVYGFTSKPLEFNALNPIKRPLPVWAARLIYLPFGFLFVGLGVRVLARLVLK